MADIVSRDELAKNKLDCFYKWYTFEEITCPRYLHRIGWKGKAISQCDFSFKQTNIRWIISANISVKQPVTFS